jgi:hypothetical protein
MSLLDTLLTVFEFDTSEIDVGLKDVDKGTKKVEKSLTDAEKSSQKLATSLKGVAAQFAGAIASAVGLYAAISGINAAAQVASDLKTMADATGSSVEALDAWGNAVEKSGGSAYYFQWTVRYLNQALDEAAKTGTGNAAEALKTLGISFKKADGSARDFIELLPEIADAFDGLSVSESTNLGEKLGLDWGTIQLLQKGRAGVEEMIQRQKELGVVTAKDAEVAAAYVSQQKDTERAWRSLWTVIGTAVLPIFTQLSKMVEVAVSWMSRHSHFVIGALIAIGGAITAYVLPPLVRMAIASVVAFAPYYGIAAIIAGVGLAFALIYDDVMHFLEGNNSVIGLMLEKWPLVGDVFKGIGEILKGLWGALIGIGEIILNPIQSVMIALNDLLSLYNKVKSALGFGGGEDMKATLDQTKKISQEISGNSMASQTSASIGASNSHSRNTNVQVGDVTISTQATDAEGVRDAFSNSLEDQIRKSLANFDDGVRA